MMTTPPPPPGKGKKGQKKKLALAGGAAAVAVAGIAFARSRSGSSGSSPDTSSGGSYTATQPADFTGDDGEGDLSDLYSSLDSLQEQLATITADENPPGKPTDLWDLAKDALEGRGITSPTNSQIYAERYKLFGVGKAPKKPKKPSGKKPNAGGTRKKT